MKGMVSNMGNMNLPNKLTVVRVIMIVPFIVFLLGGQAGWFRVEGGQPGETGSSKDPSPGPRAHTGRERGPGGVRLRIWGTVRVWFC